MRGAPGIIASRPGMVDASALSLITASRKAVTRSYASPMNGPAEAPSPRPMALSTKLSQRSRRSEARVVPRAGQATRT